MAIEAKDFSKTALKLHKQFGHPNCQKLLKLIKNAGMRNRKFEKVVEKVSDDCEICKRHKRPVPRPVVAVPMAEKFNDLVAMDLKSYNNIYFLVMVDYATRFCAAEVIADKKPDTIVKAIFNKWISLFGPARKFLFDNGGEFQKSPYF